MTGGHATLSVYDLHPDTDEPEQEDTDNNSSSSEDDASQIVKPSLRQPALFTDTVMQHRPVTEVVYPWMPTDSDSIGNSNESVMIVPTTLHITDARSEPGPRARDGVTTALLPRTFGHTGVEPQGYGSMQLRHSILRINASKTSSGTGLRKSSSVEFVLDHVHYQTASSIYATTSSIGREPRRLTFEEKAELYRIRPDLEIGPDPYLTGQVEELNRRNQRRVIFALFGGFISIILLLVLFSMWERSSSRRLRVRPG